MHFKMTVVWLNYRSNTKYTHIFSQQKVQKMKICSQAGPHCIWAEKGRCLPLHSALHFSPFLRLFTFILLMIPFLRLILCLHLVSVPPPPPHISPSIRLPPCVLTRCVVCLFTRDVNIGMNVQVTVGVTFTASFSLKTAASPSPPRTSCGRPSSAP